MARVMVVLIAMLFVGVAMAGCVSSDDDGDGDGGLGDGGSGGDGGSDGGGSAGDTNTAPVAKGTWLINGLTVTFTDASTDADEDNLTHLWDFGDDSTSTDASPEHTYADYGTYVVKLTVNDGEKEHSTTGSFTLEAPVVVPDPIHLSGTDDQAMEFFHLEGGLSVFTILSEEAGYFSIWLKDDNGENVDLLVSATDPFDGSTATNIETAGEYFIEVTSNDVWNVTITQPRPTSAPEVPQTYADDSDEATPFFNADGLVRFHATYSGDGYFSVWLLDEDGNNEDLLFSETDAFDGTATASVDSGIYLLKVTADTAWTIDVT